MNRKEFIESCAQLSEEELKKTAAEMRERAASRIPPEVEKLFRSLDEETDVTEMYAETSFGKTHLFIVTETDPDEDLPVLINIHGGGWSLPHTERDIYFSRRMAKEAGCIVVDVDYVLAPEYPYPAAILELEALFEKLPGILAKWKADLSRIVICGQSAGGNLSAAVLQRNFHGLMIKGAVLCYLPADNYNDHFHGEELDERGKSTEYYGFFYNRNFEERKNSDVSLVNASIEELRHLPPTDIMTAGKDNLLDEGRKYYERLKEAGIETTYTCFENSRHGFLINLYDQWQEGEEFTVRRILHHFTS